METAFFIEFNGKRFSWDSMENIPWNSMEFHAQYQTEFHGIPWKKFHGIPWGYFTREFFIQIVKESCTWIQFFGLVIFDKIFDKKVLPSTLYDKHVNCADMHV